MTLHVLALIMGGMASAGTLVLGGMYMHVSGTRDEVIFRHAAMMVVYVRMYEFSTHVHN